MTDKDGLFLSDDEVRFLTGRRRRLAQVSALRGMGIEHKVRPDGSVVVSRQHVEESLGVTHSRSERQNIEPDWSSLG